MGVFDDVRSKINRANEHIRNFEAITADIYNPTAHIRRYYDAKAGNIVFCVDGDIPPVPTELNILCGECVYQLRSALNHLIYKISTATLEEKESLEFPIFSKSETFHKNRGGGRRLKGVAHDVAEFIKSKQPFQRGTNYNTHPLWKLHELSNADKHTFLIRISVEAHPPLLGFDGAYVERQVKFSSGSKDGDPLATVESDDPELDVHVEPSIHVCINDIDYTGFTSATDFLKRLSRDVSEIIEAIINHHQVSKLS